jgi:hypothetical protein
MHGPRVKCSRAPNQNVYDDSWPTRDQTISELGPPKVPPEPEPIPQLLSCIPASTEAVALRPSLHPVEYNRTEDVSKVNTIELVNIRGCECVQFDEFGYGRNEKELDKSRLRSMMQTLSGSDGHDKRLH